MDHIEIKDADKITEDIFKAWQLEIQIENEEVEKDVKSAIEEAYMTGCIHGKLDNDLFEAALKYLKV